MNLTEIITWIEAIAIAIWNLIVANPIKTIGIVVVIVVIILIISNIKKCWGIFLEWGKKNKYTLVMLYLLIIFIIFVLIIGSVGLLTIPIVLILLLINRTPFEIKTLVKFVFTCFIVFISSQKFTEFLAHIPITQNIPMSILQNSVLGVFLYIFIFQMDLMNTYKNYPELKQVSEKYKKPKENKRSDKEVLKSAQIYYSVLPKILNTAINKFLIIISYFTVPLIIVYIQSTKESELDTLVTNYLNAFYFLTLPITLFIWNKKQENKNNNKEDTNE